MILHTVPDGLADAVGGLLVLNLLVDALLDEDLLEREPVLAIDQLLAVVLEFRLQLGLELIRERLRDLGDR